MRQVPHYTIIGSDCVAVNLCHYFDLKSINYTHWHRQSKQSLANSIQKNLKALEKDAFKPIYKAFYPRFRSWNRSESD